MYVSFAKVDFRKIHGFSTSVTVCDQPCRRGQLDCPHSLLPNFHLSFINPRSLYKSHSFTLAIDSHTAPRFPSSNSEEEMKASILLATAAAALSSPVLGAPSINDLRHTSRANGPNSKDLFPVPFKSAFTTSSYTGSNVLTVELADKPLGVVKVSSGTKHNVVPGPDTPNGLPKAWEAFYAKGSMNPSSELRGGFGFYMAGPPAFDYTSATEAIFSYSIYFEPGFQFA